MAAEGSGEARMAAEGTSSCSNKRSLTSLMGKRLIVGAAFSFGRCVACSGWDAGRLPLRVQMRTAAEGLASSPLRRPPGSSS